MISSIILFGLHNNTKHYLAKGENGLQQRSLSSFEQWIKS